MDKEKITGSAPTEYKDNLHGQPLEFYGEKFRGADPQKIAGRLQLPFNQETGELCVRFLGKKYHISITYNNIDNGYTSVNNISKTIKIIK